MQPDPRVAPTQSCYLRDGSTVSGSLDAVARASSIDRDLALQERAWVEQLRTSGIRAAHPDDGWVNRDENKIHLAYPQFNDGIGIGALVALGSPSGKTRIVRITGTSENRFAFERPWYFHFEATNG